ncbi:MAG: thiamine phosphate synthase [Bacteroidia bacterium]
MSIERIALTPPYLEIEKLPSWRKKALDRGAQAFLLRHFWVLSPPQVLQVAEIFEGDLWLIHQRSYGIYVGNGMHFSAADSLPAYKPHSEYLWGKSCHNLSEIEGIASKVDYIFLGPFFPTHSHPGASLLSLEVLRQARTLFPALKIYALGGIMHPWQVEKVRIAGATGFAAIQFFL